MTRVSFELSNNSPRSAMREMIDIMERILYCGGRSNIATQAYRIWLNAHGVHLAQGSVFCAVNEASCASCRDSCPLTAHCYSSPQLNVWNVLDNANGLYTTEQQVEALQYLQEAAGYLTDSPFSSLEYLDGGDDDEE